MLQHQHVRQWHLDLDVKPPGSQNCWVDVLRVVAGTNHHEPFLQADAVHLLQETSDYLRSISAAVGVAAGARADRVDLIDENDAGRILPCFIEAFAHREQQVAKMTGALPLGAAGLDAIDPGAPAHCASEVALAGARQAKKQQGVRDLSPGHFAFGPQAQVCDQLPGGVIGRANAGDHFMRWGCFGYLRRRGGECLRQALRHLLRRGRTQGKRECGGGELLQLAVRGQRGAGGGFINAACATVGLTQQGDQKIRVHRRQ